MNLLVKLKSEQFRSKLVLIAVIILSALLVGWTLTDGIMIEQRGGKIYSRVDASIRDISIFCMPVQSTQMFNWNWCIW